MLAYPWFSNDITTAMLRTRPGTLSVLLLRDFGTDNVVEKKKQNKNIVPEL